jgi:DNA repair protein RecO (recombination protein O)
MVDVTKGIVLHHINYSETSIILKVFTELNGLQSFIIKGFKSPSSKNKKTLIQPLSIIELVAYPNQKGEIGLLKEITLDYYPKSLYIDMKKTAVVFFLDEILYKSIKEHEPNQQLYDFIYNSIVHLDNITDKISLFNLFFTLQLTKYLGFYPELNYSESNNYFDLIDGIYTPVAPGHSFYIEPELSAFFYQLSVSDINNYSNLSIDYKYRTLLLNKICDYYRVHIIHNNEIKSLDVLENFFKK